jgi:hypothetical protein
MTGSSRCFSFVIRTRAFWLTLRISLNVLSGSAVVTVKVKIKKLAATRTGML